MHDFFITTIHIGKVRHLVNFDITLSDKECTHLILTGKNGSGKTSLLEAMRDAVLLNQRDAVTKKYSTITVKKLKMFPGLFEMDIEKGSS